MSGALEGYTLTFLSSLLYPPWMNWFWKVVIPNITNLCLAKRNIETRNNWKFLLGNEILAKIVKEEEEKIKKSICRCFLTLSLFMTVYLHSYFAKWIFKPWCIFEEVKKQNTWLYWWLVTNYCIEISCRNSE